MSIYNPPSKTQGIFNPSNYGGLGTGGQITTDYLDANYLSFPVAQGNTTLVGASVFGTISQQQGDFTTTGDLLVNDVNVITEIGTKQDTIEDGDLTIAKTSGLQTALDNKYDDTGGTINGNVSITGGLLVGTTNIIDELGDKQDTIEDGDLTIAKTNGLQSALDDKQDEIADGDLTIAKTAGLQTALDAKQDTITTNDLAITDTAGLQTALDGKQATITTDDLTITDTAGLQTALDAKQATITTATDLTLNSITTTNLNTSGKVGFDTTNIQFNTLVLRRPTGNDKIILNEIQVWVNDVNIMVEPTNNLIGYFADWDTDKDAEIPPLTFQDIERGVDKVYNNILENNNDFGAHSGSNTTNALIIKDIPLTNINDIQSIVYYNRSDEDRSIGLVLEFYNTIIDDDLNYPLASSNVISTYSLIYRFDFPSISSYTAFTDSNSITNIVNDTIALTETIIVSNIEMTGNVSMNNDLSVGGSLFLGDTNLTEDIDGLLTLDTSKRLTINGLTSGFVTTGEVNCDYLNTTFEGKFGIPDSGNDLTLSGTQIKFNSDSFISNTAGGNSGNHLVIFVNGTEYKIKLENAS